MEFHFRANYFDRLYFGLVPQGESNSQDAN